MTRVEHTGSRISPFSSRSGEYHVTDTVEPAARAQLKWNEKLVPVIDKNLIEEAIRWFAEEILPTIITPSTVVMYNLKGAEHFFTRLKKYYPNLQAYPVRVSRSAGHMAFGEFDESRMQWLPEEVNLEDKDVLLIEDVNDEGLTLNRLITMCQEQGARKVQSVVLFEKLVEEVKGAIPTYALLQVINKFLVGRGLDEGNDRFREVEVLYILITLTSPLAIGWNAISRVATKLGALFSPNQKR